MKSFLILLVFLSLVTLHFSCQKDKATANVKSDIVIEHPSGFSVHFQRNQLSPGILDVLKEEEVSALLQLVNYNFSRLKSEYVKLINFKLDLGEKYSYLIFEGYNKSTKSTSPFAYSIEFDSSAQRATFKRSSAKNDNKLSGSGNSKELRTSDEIAEGNHTCSGSPCNCCAFLRYANGSIYGCICLGGSATNCFEEEGQKCNHTQTGIDDIDGDGVADQEDECPYQPGPLSNMGCPIQ